MEGFMCGKDMEEEVVTYSRNYPGNCLEGLRKTKIGHDNR
jgi:hypothetical protein